MKQSLAGVLLAEVPEAIVCGANGRTAVFRGRYDVNVFEFRLANDPLIGHAVEGHATRITKIAAGVKIIKVVHEIKQSDFQRSRSEEHTSELQSPYVISY